VTPARRTNSAKGPEIRITSLRYQVYVLLGMPLELDRVTVSPSTRYAPSRPDVP